MLDLIRNIDITLAGYLSVAMLSLVILGHALVILKVIPYTWINGGRSVSYEAQKKQSIIGIIALLANIAFFLVASNIISVDMGSMGNKIIDIILWILAILFMISTVMQLLGTKFERYVMSVIVLILLVCIFRMII